MDASFQIANEFNRRTHGMLIARIDTAIVRTASMRVSDDARNCLMDAELVIKIERQSFEGKVGIS
ncbi:MAG TPA: hypothetical protein VF493_04665, partial [Terriglobales bacterium]